jgi:hypothetical protein
MVDKKHYKKGQLVRLRILNRCFTDEGFVTVSTTDVIDNSRALIHEKISLSNYPSCNDFFGGQTVVRHGDLATVLSFKGRPFQINSDLQWDYYDVYEILIAGSIRNIFSFNIEPLNIVAELKNDT